MKSQPSRLSGSRVLPGQSGLSHLILSLISCSTGIATSSSSWFSSARSCRRISCPTFWRSRGGGCACRRAAWRFCRASGLLGSDLGDDHVGGVENNDSPVGVEVGRLLPRRKESAANCDRRLFVVTATDPRPSLALDCLVTFKGEARTSIPMF